MLTICSPKPFEDEMDFTFFRKGLDLRSSPIQCGFSILFGVAMAFVTLERSSSCSKLSTFLSAQTVPDESSSETYREYLHESI